MVPKCTLTCAPEEKAQVSITRAGQGGGGGGPEANVQFQEQQSLRRERHVVVPSRQDQVCVGLVELL
jgi:hypothetical protein